MYRAGTSLTPMERANEDMPIGLGSQETPSESSEGDSSECDTTGDEDGWESGESFLVMKRHSHTHGCKHNTPCTVTQYRASLEETNKESHPCEEVGGSQKSTCH